MQNSFLRTWGTDAPVRPPPQAPLHPPSWEVRLPVAPRRQARVRNAGAPCLPPRFSPAPLPLPARWAHRNFLTGHSSLFVLPLLPPPAHSPTRWPPEWVSAIVWNKHNKNKAFEVENPVSTDFLYRSRSIRILGQFRSTTRARGNTPGACASFRVLNKGFPRSLDCGCGKRLFVGRVPLRKVDGKERKNMKSRKRDNGLMTISCCLWACLAVVLAGNAWGETPRPSSLEGGSQYELIPWTAGWHAAKTDAEARGGHLATITSEAEWTEICRLFTPGELAGTWLGATDEQSEGHWEWVTGEPFAFARWTAGEPNNAGNAEHYLGFRNAASPSWNDSPDTFWYMTKYLLEYENGCVPITSGKTTAASLLFKTGRHIDCNVLSYSNGYFEVQLEDGTVRQAPAANIACISFSAPVSSTPTISSPPPRSISTERAVSAEKVGDSDKGSLKLNHGITLVAKKYELNPDLEHWELLSIKKKKRKAVAIQVQITNNTGKSIEVDDRSFTLKDQDDNIVPADWFITGTRKTLYLHVDVHPGDTIAMWVAFKIPLNLVLEKSFIRYNERHNGDSPESMYSDWVPIGK